MAQVTLPAPTVRIYFGLEYSPGAFFTLGDPVRGELDNVTYLLGTDDGLGVDVSIPAFDIAISRGRSRELDEFEVGTCTVQFRNENRDFDPMNTAGPYYGDLVPGVGDLIPGKRVEIMANGVMIFAGTIEDWTTSWTVDGASVAEMTAVDALGDLGLKEFDAWTTSAGQLPGARIEAALDRPEVTFGSNRDIGTGASTLTGDSVTWGSNVLNYLQLVAQSERGRLFASRENVLTFRGRHDLVGADTVLRFADDGTGVKFHGSGTESGSKLLFNRVGIDREGGTLQTKEDVASQDKHGVRPYPAATLLLDSDGQSESMAEYLLNVYKDATPRVPWIMVKVHALDPADAASVCALEIGDLIELEWIPNGIDGPVTDGSGSLGEYIVVIEGISTTITSAEHIVTLSVAPPTQTGVFILDDPVWGIIGPARYGVLSF